MAVQKQPSSEDDSMLSFVPAGMPRSIVEYIVALIPGALLLFIFFVGAEAAMLLVDQDILAVIFLPVVCVMPILAGAVSTLALEKLRSKPLTLQRGAVVGLAAGFVGSLVSAIALAVIQLLTQKAPFGSFLSGLLVYAVLLVIIVMDAVLGALGGALVVKFVKPAVEAHH